MINDKMKIIAEQQSQRVVLKGNTIKYNNLVQNGNFENTSGWTAQRVNFSVSNNVAKLVVADSSNWFNFYFPYANVSGHKYLAIFTAKASVSHNLYLLSVSSTITTEFQTFGVFYTATATGSNNFNLSSNQFAVNDEIYFKNVIFIDLTLLCLSVSTLTDFYATDLGKFIQNGNYLPYSANNTIYSVKSPFTFKGRNLINYKTEYDTGDFNLNGNVLENIRVDERVNDNFNFTIYDFDLHGDAFGKTIKTNGRTSLAFTPTHSGEYKFYHSGSSVNLVFLKCYLENGQTYTISFDVISHDSRVIGGLKLANIQLEKGDKATPYLVYVNQLVYIRTKRVDLGTLNWNRNSGTYPTNVFYNTTDIDVKVATQLLNYSKNLINSMYISSNGKIILTAKENYSSATDFKTAMSGTILEYETAEPLELNGIGTNYDTFENHSGKVVRTIKKVKLKDLTYTKSSTFFAITKPTDFNDNKNTKLICSKYDIEYSASLLELKDKAISVVVALTGEINLILKDTDYPNVIALINSFTDNDYLYYELNAPTTENERSVLVDHRYTKVVDSNGNEIDTD